MKLYETTWEDETIEIFGENHPELGGKHLVIKMNQSTEFLPEWTFSNDESAELLQIIQDWFYGTP